MLAGLALGWHAHTELCLYACTLLQDTRTAEAAAAAVAQVEEQQLKLMQAAGQFNGQLDRMEMLER
jgi:hypothetical protein